MTSIFENVFVQLPNCVFLKNTRSEFITCNANIAKAAGILEPKDIYGKTDYDLLWADSHAEIYREEDQGVLQGESKINVIEAQFKNNGDIISIIVNKTPLLNESGDKIGVIGSYMEAVPRELLSEFDCTKMNYRITKAESDFLYYIAKGLSLAQIADKVEMPILMVKSHIETLKKKLNCSSDVALQKKSLSLDIIKKRLLGLQADSYDSLTKQEMDIIQYLMRGKTAKDIASELQLSPQTNENSLPTKHQDTSHMDFNTDIRLLKMDDLRNILSEKIKISISKREIECLFYLVRGKSARETGAQLNLSQRTVEYYLNCLKEKFHCTKKSDIIGAIYNLC